VRTKNGEYFYYFRGMGHKLAANHLKFEYDIVI